MGQENIAGPPNGRTLSLLLLIALAGFMVLILANGPLQTAGLVVFIGFAVGPLPGWWSWYQARRAN